VKEKVGVKRQFHQRGSDPGLHSDGREADGRRVPIDVHRSEGLRKDVLRMFGRIKNGSRPWREDNTRLSCIKVPKK
jgi:hypothetical protein